MTVVLYHGLAATALGSLLHLQIAPALLGAYPLLPPSA